MTAQQGENLIYENKKYCMFSEPFNQYIIKNKLDLRLISRCTSLWRGYLGNWEIIENELYLIDISGYGLLKDNEKYKRGKIKLRKILKKGIITPQQNGYLLKKLEQVCLTNIELSLQTLFNSNDKVFADWYSGFLRIPIGDMIEYIHMGYASVFEKTMILKVVNGTVIEKVIIDNSAPIKSDINEDIL